MNRLVAVVLIAACAVFGVWVLLGWAQRYDCGAPGEAAFLQSVQALGAAPSVAECLGIAATWPDHDPAAVTPPATTSPPPPTTEPTPAWAEAVDACNAVPMADPANPTAAERRAWEACIRSHGVEPSQIPE